MSAQALDIVLKYFSDFTDKQVEQLRALEGGTKDEPRPDSYRDKGLRGLAGLMVFGGWRTLF